MLTLVGTSRDMHKVRAAQIFNVEYDAVTPHQRKIAKQIFWLAAYGNNRARRILR